jgi:hypothetical protein
LAKKPETLLKEKVLEDLKELREVYAVKIQQVAVRGTLDIFVCAAGNFIALELKSSEEEDLDPLQKHEAEKIRRAGGYAAKVTPANWPGVFSQIKRLVYFEQKTVA